jgi:AcrR family transcriptional regulator
MPRPPDVERRQQLVDGLVDAYARDGLRSRSMRELAAELGTSHRMLIHHFGSREGMLVAVVEAVERRQAETLATLDGSPAEIGERFWAILSDPSLRPFERLFFECYIRGANGEPPFDRLLPDAVTTWLDADQSDDPDFARLGLAVVRGLLLDLIATGDEAATTRALLRFIQQGQDAQQQEPA